MFIYTWLSTEKNIPSKFSFLYKRPCTWYSLTYTGLYSLSELIQYCISSRKHCSESIILFTSLPQKGATAAWACTYKPIIIQPDLRPSQLNLRQQQLNLLQSQKNLRPLQPNLRPSQPNWRQQQRRLHRITTKNNNIVILRITTKPQDKTRVRRLFCTLVLSIRITIHGNRITLSILFGKPYKYNNRLQRCIIKQLITKNNQNRSPQTNQ